MARGLRGRQKASLRNNLGQDDMSLADRSRRKWRLALLTRRERQLLLRPFMAWERCNVICFARYMPSAMLRDTIETLSLNEQVLVIQKQSNQPLTLGHVSLSLCCADVVVLGFGATQPCAETQLGHLWVRGPRPHSLGFLTWKMGLIMCEVEMLTVTPLQNWKD